MARGTDKPALLSLARRVSRDGFRFSSVGVLFLLAAILIGLRTPTPALSQGKSASAPDPARIVEFLDQTIAWYRQLGGQQRLVSDANDAVFVSSDRQIAEQVVRLVFQFARAEAEAMPEQAAAATQQTSGQPTASPYLSLIQQEAKAQQHENQVQGEMEDLRNKIAVATGQRRRALKAQFAETQSEVNLAQARVEAFRSMVQFMTGATTESTALGSQIDALASMLPAELVEPSKAASNPASALQQATLPAPAANTTAGSGLWGILENLFATWRKLRSIDGSAQQTQALARSAQEIRTPMANRLRELIQRGDELAQQADTANSATLMQEKQQLDALTQQFKQLTAAAIPIAQAEILMGLYQKNLANWHNSVWFQLLAQSRGLLVRGLLLATILAVVFGASELWRRAIYRYVHDIHRRSQLHWVRRIVVWLLAGTITVFSFVSRIGSIATFAGLLTAGIALALQNVIQSVVGYFFLIGKYGIRAGDRVQIGGVSGDVIDVGLVRIHLMEMSGAAAGTPTGRIVAFSNSIVFQPTTGLFKKIPGTNFAWHEINLSLPADAKFTTVREQLMKAVETGLGDYKDEIARQHSAMEETLEAAPGIGFEPSVQLQFTGSGLEASVRYPVTLWHAMEIDESVTRTLLSNFDLTHSGGPPIRLKTTSAA